MTKGEFQRKVIELLRRYRPSGKMRSTILPLFTLVDSLTDEEMRNIYRIVEEAVITQQETERLSDQLQHIYIDLNRAIGDISKRLQEIKKRLDVLRRQADKSLGGNDRQSSSLQINKSKRGSVMKYNQHSFSGEKPNFGLKLNKLFSAYITEYGPDFITMVISDSILYTNNLILRISLKSKDVMIGSSRSIKLYETKNEGQFLVTDKPEVIPYGNTRGFYFKYITYEDILNLTNGDFSKVFAPEILTHYKVTQTGLARVLQKVGYYHFE